MIPFSGSLIATCPGGLETVLGQELDDAGFRNVRKEKGAVSFEGGAEEMIRANLELRTASRVLLPLKSSVVRSFDDVYNVVAALSWERILPVSRTFNVSAFSSSRELRDHRFLAMKIKDALVDRQRRKTGRRSSVNRQFPDIALVGHIQGDRFTVSIDSSGRSLHERGYRTEAGEAPLRENLAAGMVLSTGWKPGGVFLDPFCGSGTIVIEAALLEADIAPGILGRKYAFESWPDQGPWNREDIESLLEPDPVAPGGDLPPRIFCSDIDTAMVEMARRNADRAGVLDRIVFETVDFFERSAPTRRIVPGVVDGSANGSVPESVQGPARGVNQSAVLITNPPFGERLALESVAAQYRRIGERLKSEYVGWSAHVLGPMGDAGKSFGLKVARRMPLFNGPLECRLYGMEIF